MLVLGVLHFHDITRKSNRPEKLKEDFMWESGYTHSLVAMRYFFNRPQEGRAAIENDPTIRRKYVTERILKSIAIFCLGVFILLQPLCLLLWNAVV